MTRSIEPRWTLVCGGDIMLNDLPVSKRRLRIIEPLLNSATVSFANLEAPLTNSNVRTLNKTSGELQQKTQYVLKADTRNATLLKGWGFKALTEGNNHAMDYGPQGLAQMLGALDKQGIRHTGAGKNAATAWKPVLLPIGEGVSMSLAAALAFAGEAGAQKCTPAGAVSPGVATLYLRGKQGFARLKRKIENLRKGGGPVILFLHWGTERATVPRPYQVALGRACVDAGADAVIGAHPHVLQGAELYRGKPIFYSLGNLVVRASCGIALAELRFEGRKFIEFRLHPYLNNGGVLIQYKQPDLSRSILRFKELEQKFRRLFPSKRSKFLSFD
jgi:poly-gamma-glutamate capsule biosynthesis protein CapA/YwtB (metallophosphatase superfamily)